MAEEAGIKYATSDCGDCPYALRGRGADDLLARWQPPAKLAGLVERRRYFCVWGRGLRVLSPAVRARSCGLRGRAAPGAGRWLGLLGQPPVATTALPWDRVAG